VRAPLSACAPCSSSWRRTRSGKCWNDSPHRCSFARPGLPPPRPASTARESVLAESSARLRGSRPTSSDSCRHLASDLLAQLKVAAHGRSLPAFTNRATANSRSSLPGKSIVPAGGPPVAATKAQGYRRSRAQRRCAHPHSHSSGIESLNAAAAAAVVFYEAARQRNSVPSSHNQK